MIGDEAVPANIIVYLYLRDHIRNSCKLKFDGSSFLVSDILVDTPDILSRGGYENVA